MRFAHFVERMRKGDFIPMPRTRIVGLSEEQVMHALGIDDAYHIERTFAEGRTGVTQLVTIEGSGPFVRKKIPSSLANRAVWAALADCESLRLPRVAATYEMPDCFVAVCDYIPGDTIEHAMAARGRLTAAEAVRIAQDICDAVSNLHEHGIVHCDIAPSNVVVAADGAHLIDFGIAQPMGAHASNSAVGLGTWGFAAPEQYGFSLVDARSDVYSITQMLGYMLTGVLPDPGSSAFAEALADSAIVPSSLAEVVRRGSAFEPSARYQSAAELSCAIAEAGENEGVAACDAQGPGRANPSVDAQAPKRSDESLRQEAYESAQAYYAAQGETRRRESRVNAAIKIGFLSIAVISAIAGVALLTVGSLAHLSQIYQGFFADTEQGEAGGATSDGSLTDDEKQDIASAAALAGVQEGFDAAKDSWSSGIASKDEVDAAFEALSLEDSGWWVAPSGYVHYAFVLGNAEDGFRVEFPTVKIIGRDASGGVLFSDEQVLNAIDPGRTVCFGSQAGNGTAPDSVEFVIARPQDFAVSKNSVEPPVLKTSNVSAVSDGFGGVDFTGEVTYSEGPWPTTSMNQIAVTVVLRNDAGEIVYGATGYTDRPAEGGSSTFDVMAGKVPEYATVEAYAQPW